ncbi:MAG: DNA polymerase III subunit gamma/tau, partial [Rhodospirillales bacterium]|nr:DNA polymerase III subunit gamma/tau [Rhodospirillales bacterium]
AADLPSPAELVAQMKKGGAAAGRAPVPSSGGMGGRAPVSAAVAPVPGTAQPSGQPVPGTAPRAALAPQAAPAVHPLEIADFQQVVALFQEKREAVLCSHLRGDVHLVRCEPGRLELRTKASAPRDLASRLSQLLTEWTGQRWVVTISNQQGAPTLREQEEEATRRRLHDAAEHPLVQAVLAAFPGATIEKVCDLAPDEPEAADDQTAFAESETVSGEDD